MLLGCRLPAHWGGTARGSWLVAAYALKIQGAEAPAPCDSLQHSAEADSLVIQTLLEVS